MNQTKINYTRCNGFVHCGVRWNHIGVGIGADKFFNNIKWTGEIRDGGHGWVVKPSKLRGMINPIIITSETPEETIALTLGLVNKNEIKNQK